MLKLQKNNQHGFSHVLLIIGIIVVVGVIGFSLNMVRKANDKDEVAPQAAATNLGGQNMGDPDSLDPVQKGLASTGGKCTGKGSTKMAFAPMKAADIGTIAPMGEYGGSHVTPIDHQYYYGIDPNKPKDTYAVYAVMDGDLTSMGSASTPTGTNWNITLAHSCTFMVLYNLMTSISPDIMKQVPNNWREMGGAVKVPVKAGQLIGYVGGQSLDFQVGDTTFTNPKLLYHTAYNNTEPFKINTVHPLDYFAENVKSEILPKYLRVAEPRDGNYAYDIDGTATGTWFKVGTNGYAGGTGPTSNTNNTTQGHLALAYGGFDPSALVVSTGNYQNGVSKELVVNDKSIDWTKITPESGPVKVQLAEASLRTSSGGVWNGGYVAGGLKLVPNTNLATALIQLTAKQEMKFELFIGKTPGQVNGFDNNVVMYNRGQDAHMNKSTTASPSVDTN